MQLRLVLMAKFATEGVKIALTFGAFLCLSNAYEVSVSCMMAYDEGGASAVFSSPECPRLDFSAAIQNGTDKCLVAMHQGRRRYQEDRIICYPRVIVPILVHDESTHGILKKALLRTIQDIDSEFSQEALNNDYISGSTATFVLWMSGQMLVGSLGDSKALLCSRRTHFDQDSEGDLVTRLQAEELTRDHHPDRDDEKARIEAAGGAVLVVGVPRVNGILAVSRSIGDIRLKRYGVIAEPEVTGWRHLNTEDSYMVLGSDGIFETMSPQDVCDILHGEHDSFLCPSSSSLGDCIVHSAFTKGSSDNLSVIVIPMRKNPPLPEHKEQR